MGRLPIQLLLAGFVIAGNGPLLAANKKTAAQAPVRAERPVQKSADGAAEARLIEIYKLIGQSQSREALAKAGKLVDDLPNFQLAQLVYADLLVARSRGLKNFGDAPDASARLAGSTLNELREESQRRMRALRERPTPGTIPSHFLALSPRSKHAIAVDASRSRLYLFENSAAGMRLAGDYYISVGKAGTAKTVEGDQRTPLGIYYITSNLDPKSLKDFYGSGALPISYPNILDSKRGKTGSGIWLHGTPPNQFSRPPLATDGCVVLANPDLQHIINTVEVRTTPVVIATELQWVGQNHVRSEGKPFEEALHAWRNAKTSGNVQQILSFYTPDFTSNGKTLAQWTPTLRAELTEVKGRNIQLKDVSYLRWTDATDTMVVTFGEVADGTRTGWTKRQYWLRQGSQWKIFFEGVI
ncbi:MAG: L,D-transpeptidase family protein [Burkholderiales bacterium]|nr:L,D-transpeptidase family protein [Burkholderiales bacterium]